MKKIIIIIFMLVLLVGCSKGSVTKTDAIKFKEEYESLNNEKNSYNDELYRTLDIEENNPIIYKNASDIIEMIDEKQTFAIYFGFNSCPWCRSIISTLMEVCNDLDIDTIYYVDVKDIRDIMEINDDGDIFVSKEGTNDYYKLLDRLNPILDDYVLTDKEGNEINTNTKRIYAPNIVSVIKGVPTKMTTGISDIQENAYMELTEDIKKDSYDMIKCTIECIAEEKNICTIDKKC